MAAAHANIVTITPPSTLLTGAYGASMFIPLYDTSSATSAFSLELLSGCGNADNETAPAIGVLIAAVDYERALASAFNVQPGTHVLLADITGYTGLPTPLAGGLTVTSDGSVSFSGRCNQTDLVTDVSPVALASSGTGTAADLEALAAVLSTCKPILHASKSPENGQFDGEIVSTASMLMHWDEWNRNGAATSVFAFRIANRVMAVVITSEQGLFTSDNAAVYITAALGTFVSIATSALVWAALSAVASAKRLAIQRSMSDKKALSAAERAHYRTITYLSHETRNPLNVIATVFKLLVDAYSFGHEDSENVHAAQLAITKMQAVLDDINDFAAIESGQIQPHLEAVAVRKEIAHVVAQQVLSDPPRVPIRWQIDSTVPTKIYSDALRFAQILSNGLDNACRHARTGEVVINVSVTENFQAHTVLAAGTVDSSNTLDPAGNNTLTQTHGTVSAQSSSNSVLQQYSRKPLSISSLTKVFQGSRLSKSSVHPFSEGGNRPSHAASGHARHNKSNSHSLEGAPRTLVVTITNIGRGLGMHRTASRLFQPFTHHSLVAPGSASPESDNGATSGWVHHNSGNNNSSGNSLHHHHTAARSRGLEAGPSAHSVHQDAAHAQPFAIDNTDVNCTNSFGLPRISSCTSVESALDPGCAIGPSPSVSAASATPGVAAPASGLAPTAAVGSSNTMQSSTSSASASSNPAGSSTHIGSSRGVSVVQIDALGSSSPQPFNAARGRSRAAADRMPLSAAPALALSPVVSPTGSSSNGSGSRPTGIRAMMSRLMTRGVDADDDGQSATAQRDSQSPSSSPIAGAGRHRDGHGRTAGSSYQGTIADRAANVGFGLPLAAKIAQILGGRIQIYDEHTSVTSAQPPISTADSAAGGVVMTSSAPSSAPPSARAADAEAAAAAAAGHGFGTPRVGQSTHHASSQQQEQHQQQQQVLNRSGSAASASSAASGRRNSPGPAAFVATVFQLELPLVALPRGAVLHRFASSDSGSDGANSGAVFPSMQHQAVAAQLYGNEEEEVDEYAVDALPGTPIKSKKPSMAALRPRFSHLMPTVDTISVRSLGSDRSASQQRLLQRAAELDGTTSPQEQVRRGGSAGVLSIDGGRLQFSGNGNAGSVSRSNDTSLPHLGGTTAAAAVRAPTFQPSFQSVGAKSLDMSVHTRYTTEPANAVQDGTGASLDGLQRAQNASSSSYQMRSPMGYDLSNLRDSRMLTNFTAGSVPFPGSAGLHGMPGHEEIVSPLTSPLASAVASGEYGVASSLSPADRHQQQQSIQAVSALAPLRLPSRGAVQLPYVRTAEEGGVPSSSSTAGHGSAKRPPLDLAAKRSFNGDMISSPSHGTSADIHHHLRGQRSNTSTLQSGMSSNGSPLQDDPALSKRLHGSNSHPALLSMTPTPRVGSDLRSQQFTPTAASPAGLQLAYAAGNAHVSSPSSGELMIMPSDNAALQMYMSSDGTRQDQPGAMAAPDSLEGYAHGMTVVGLGTPRSSEQAMRLQQASLPVHGGFAGGVGSGHHSLVTLGSPSSASGGGQRPLVKRQPIAHAVPANGGGGSRENTAPQNFMLKVLHADDESTNRRLMASILAKKMGCEIVSVDDGDGVIPALQHTGQLPVLPPVSHDEMPGRNSSRDTYGQHSAAAGIEDSHVSGGGLQSHNIATMTGTVVTVYEGKAGRVDTAGLTTVVEADNDSGSTLLDIASATRQQKHDFLQSELLAMSLAAPLGTSTHTASQAKVDTDHGIIGGASPIVRTIGANDSSAGSAAARPIARSESGADGGRGPTTGDSVDSGNVTPAGVVRYNGAAAPTCGDDHTHQQPFDVLLLDIVMNQLHGDVLCRMLRHQYGLAIPIIAVTSNSHDMKYLRDCGFDMVIPKPISHRRIADALVRIKNGEQLEQE